MERISSGEHNYKKMCGKILFRNKFFKETEHTRFKKFIKSAKHLQCSNEIFFLYSTFCFEQVQCLNKNSSRARVHAKRKYILQIISFVSAFSSKPFCIGTWRISVAFQDPDPILTGANPDLFQRPPIFSNKKRVCLAWHNKICICQCRFKNEGTRTRIKLENRIRISINTSGIRKRLFRRKCVPRRVDTRSHTKNIQPSIWVQRQET